MDDDELPTIACWSCEGRGESCRKCQGTGRLFWVHGRSFPYTPDGERYAKSVCRAEKMLEG